MVEYGDVPLSGMGMSGDSVVKALSNCSLLQWYRLSVYHLCVVLKYLNYLFSCS